MLDRLKKIIEIVLKVVCLILIIVSPYFLWDFLTAKFNLSQGYFFIDLLKILISFPLALLIFIFLFRKEISDRILNMSKTKFAGVEAQFKNQNNEILDANEQIEEKTREEGISFNEENIAIPKETLENIEKDINSKDEKIKELIDYTRALQIKAQGFEFLYLKQYLVLNSQIALLWCKNENRFKKNDFFEKYNLPIKVDNENIEKGVIWDHLLNIGLIQEIKNEDFTISTKGIQFLNFLGF